jgi:hypothetical protein
MALGGVIVVVRTLTSAERLELHRRAQRLRGLPTDSPTTPVADVEPLIQPSFAVRRDPESKFWLLPEEPTSAVYAWDRWWRELPDDLRRKLSVHDFRRLGELFRDCFGTQK